MIDDEAISNALGFKQKETYHIYLCCIVTDFNIGKWRESYDLDMDEPLDNKYEAILKDDLGISLHLGDECGQLDAVYVPLTNQWNNRTFKFLLFRIFTGFFTIVSLSLLLHWLGMTHLYIAI